MIRLPADAAVRAAAAQDRFREFRENIPRLAKFMAEIERGATPEQAASVTRRELVDYTRLTDFERVWVRGFMAPFYTWFKKNAENWLPGLRRDVNGSRTAGAVEAAGRIGKVMLPAYMVALYNETFFPDAERNLPEYDRNRLHMLVPTKDGLLYLGVTGPANAAAGLVGLQGFTQRSIDLLRGRTTPSEEFERSGRQMRNNVLGLLTPFTEPFEQLTNTDLRSGRRIVSDYEDLTPGERRTRRVQHAIDRFAPVSQLTRSAGDATGTPETADALVRRLLFGSIAKRVDVDGNRAKAIDQAIARGERQTADAATANRRIEVNDYASRFVEMGPDRATAFVAESWDSVDRSERSLIVSALREASRRDRRFSAVLARWRSENRSVSDAEAPLVQRELERKSLIPVTPR
jgi:hypothetical protein